MNKIKAVGLFSGGLDSTLAAKLIQNQSIDVTVLIFSSPFFNYKQEESSAIKTAEANNIPYKLIDLGTDFLKIVKKPKHGHGRKLNPCIDCKIMMFKIAKNYMKKEKADFVFTGEVLDQRPKSQHKIALDVIAKESGLKSRLLRPLSAQLLEPTYPEKKRLVDRNQLLGIQGRQRRVQYEFAKSMGIKDFSSPAGGCLLTENEYCNKLEDLLKYNKKPSVNDLLLLKIGRHFRFKKDKILVGRNREDNKRLIELKNKSDIMFIPKDIMGPTTLLQGLKTKESIKLAASLTARYSDAKNENIIVRYGTKDLNKEIAVNKITEEQINKMRI